MHVESRPDVDRIQPRSLIKMKFRVKQLYSALVLEGSEIKVPSGKEVLFLGILFTTKTCRMEFPFRDIVTERNLWQFQMAFFFSIHFSSLELPTNIWSAVERRFWNF